MRNSYPKLHSIKMKNHYNVEWLDIVTPHNINPNDVLLGAINHGMTEVVVVGFGKDGQEYFASSVGGGDGTLWHLARAQKKLLDVSDR